MYEVISYNQKSLWEERLNQLSKTDIFYHPSYSNLYQRFGDGAPYLFFYEDESGNKVGYVFLKRKIDLLPFVQDEQLDIELYDIITPSYGYGGPLGNIDDDQYLRQFRKEFEEYCQKEHIICEFNRFHPLLQNYQWMDRYMDVAYDRETVFIDLTKDESEIFNQYHKNHKRNVNKALKNKLAFKTFQSEEASKIVNDFYQLYKETMDKLHASAYSYFSEKYLISLLTDLSNNSVIGSVYFEGRMIGAALCMYDGHSLHYHLGCSQKQFLNLGGNIYLLHQMALWGKQMGLNKFHLGGGHIGRDSLFQYKYRFNPNGLLHFYIGKKVHNAQTYNWLIEKWEKYYGESADLNFFPAYRNKPQKTISVLV
ncbi:GNAT family N-acetyltransferase [Neobacillus jeddahensis]|uniref:GNAT family N-acetyltransferase n=1 Tax=Neobacillus jeddahensis TaxID=1461580 RepID=UPI00058BB799|nr:GNAT family N-acetyltransferase [Neobacillus jeddahensis]